MGKKLPVIAAERWLREHPDRVFLDRACTERFLLALPPSKRTKVHQIVVAHNVVGRCCADFGGGSGTLMFRSDLNEKTIMAMP
jgi:hypothetical protein